MSGPYNGRYMSAVGVVRYNGYRFPASLKSKITGRPIYDNANRTVKGVSYTLHVEAIVVPDDPPQSEEAEDVGENLEDLRSRLLEAGKQLDFTAQGFGEISIAAGYGSPPEISQGPRPKLLSWEPVGSNKAARIVWECEFILLECHNSPTMRKGFFTELTWEEVWSIDDEGRTTRSISATLEIPVENKDGITTDRSDNYRENFRVTVPLGFRRSLQSFTESRDRRTLDIRIVDVELATENPYYPGCVSMQVSHSCSSEGPAFVRYINRISGTITTAPGVPKAVALLAMALIVRKRYFAMVGRVAIKGEDGKPKTRANNPIPTGFTIEEEIFGREMRFSFSWVYTGDMTTFLAANNMFQPTDTNWEEWRHSMVLPGGPFSTRGRAGLKPAQVDIIVSACKKMDRLGIFDGSNYDYTTQSIGSMFSGAAPPPSQSYLDYNIELKVDTMSQALTHAITKEVDTDTVTQSDASNASPSEETTSPGDSTDAEDSSSTKHSLQLLGPAVLQVTMSGHGIRAGYPVPIPAVTEIGGRPAYLLYQTATASCLQPSATIPIFGSKWVQTYQVLEPSLKKDIYSGTKGNYGSADRA